MQTLSLDVVNSSQQCTIKIAVPSVIGTLASCSLAGYGFSRIEAPGRDLLFYIMLSTMMVPWAVTMVPVFILLGQRGFEG